jgi:hypothetical protein
MWFSITSIDGDHRASGHMRLASDARPTPGGMARLVLQTHGETMKVGDRLHLEHRGRKATYTVEQAPGAGRRLRRA